MKAVILAAGFGSRLYPLTEETPKCLVKVRGQSILDCQINAFKRSGITNICVIIGYKEELIPRHEGITYIINDKYSITNNMYSLSLAFEFINNEAFYLINGDVFIDPKIIEKLHQSNIYDCLCMDSSFFKEDSMKVILENGIVKNISKTITEESSFGSSIDLYSFSEKSSNIFFNEIITYLQHETMHWTEILLDRLFRENKMIFTTLDIAGLKWVEIDNLEDLTEAYIKFSDKDLSQMKNYYIDLDGTMYIGETFIEDAVVKVKNLSDKSITFVTNNTSHSPEHYIEKLKNKGLENFNLITPLIMIAEKFKDTKCYLLLPQDSKNYLLSQGVIEEQSNPDIIIVGYDTELTYKKLQDICLLINSGVDYILTHNDIYCPTENGPIPDVGAIACLIEKVTKKLPIEIFGKTMLKIESVSVVIGDRLYTDREMALNNNCLFILTLTGDTKISDLQNLKNWDDIKIGW